MIRAIFYASAAALLSSLLSGSFETFPICFAVIGVTFAVSAGVVLFRSEK